jgi:hypothetical protein
VNWDYKTALGARIEWEYDGAHPANNFIENAGVEDLKITNVVTDGKYAGNYTIDFQDAANCWLKNVETENGGVAHVHIFWSFGCEIRDSFFHDGSAPVAGGGSGYGVLVEGFSTNVLVENNIFDQIQASMIWGYGIQGCVFGYNYVHLANITGTTTLPLEISSHSAHPMMNLFEGNIVHKFSADNFHGSSSHLTMLRNWIKGEELGATQACWVVSLDVNQHYYNMIGNVLGESGFSGIYQSGSGRSFSNRYIWTLGYASSGASEVSDPGVETTLLRHGNFDYITGKTQWDASITDQAIPNSLYLSQKPSWWSTGAWPSIGPDETPMVSTIPAEARYNAGSTTPPAPASSLKIVP